MKLEQLKSEAKKNYLHGEFLGITTYHLDKKDLDTLITTAYNAGLERAMEVATSQKWTKEGFEASSHKTYPDYIQAMNAHNFVVDDITHQLQAEVSTK